MAGGGKKGTKMNDAPYTKFWMCDNIIHIYKKSDYPELEIRINLGKILYRKGDITLYLYQPLLTICFEEFSMEIGGKNGQK